MIRMLTWAGMKPGYRPSLFLSPAVVAVASGLTTASPASARCTSTGNTTTCSVESDRYATGIVVSDPKSVTLKLQDEVEVAPNAGVTGVAVDTLGAANLTSGKDVDIATTGDLAKAVVVTGGTVDVSLGSLETEGVLAPALSVNSAGAAKIRVGPVDTQGERSAGIVVNANGAVNITADTVTTSGNGSSGIVARTGGALAIKASAITINGSAYTPPDTGTPPGESGQDAGDADAGPDPAPVSGTADVPAAANGVEAVSRGNDIDLTIGSLAINGDGKGVVATTYGGGVVATVTGTVQTRELAFDLSAVSNVTQETIPGTGTGTDATPSVTRPVVYPLSGDPARAGVVAVNVTQGASVTGGDEPAFRISALKSATLTNSGIIKRNDPAARVIESTGGAITIINNKGGEITGSLQLTEGPDTFVNNGTYVLAGDVLFDGTGSGTTANVGSDTLTNTGVIRVPSGGFFRGVEVFNNSGLIDLRSGAAGDQVIFGRTVVGNLPGNQIIPLGQYIATGDAAIAVDLQFQDTGALTDVVNLNSSDNVSPMSVTGRTRLIVNVIGSSTPKFLVGLPIVLVPKGSTGTFSLDSPLQLGNLQYSLLYDPRQDAWALYSAPDAAALRQSKLPTNTQALWFRSNDVVSSHLREERDRRWTDEEPRSRIWLQMVGDTVSRRESYSATINRISINGINMSQRQRTFGVQGGIDSAGPEAGKTGIVFGATAGYLKSTAQFRGLDDKFKIDALAFGGYASLLAGPIYLTGAASYARHAIDDRGAEVADDGSIRGDSYGASLELGARIGSDTLFVEPSASYAYVTTSVDYAPLTFGRVLFDDLVGQSGKVGLRLGGRTEVGDRELVYYVKGEAVREFAGDDLARLTSGGADVAVPTYPVRTFGRTAAGANLISDKRFNAFIEGNSVFGRGYRGGGGRIGIRLAL